MTRLVFVDDPDRLDEPMPDELLVAVTPAVAIAAAARELDAIPLDEELDSSELEDLGRQTYERVAALCRRVDELAGGRAAAAWRFQELKSVYDGLLWTTLGTSRLADRTGATEARLLLRRDSLAAWGARAALAQQGVATFSEPFPSAPPAPDASSRRHAALSAASLAVRRALSRRCPRVLLLDQQYSLPALAAGLRGRGVDVQLWLPPPRPPRVVRLPSLDGDFWRVGGVDLAPAAEPLLFELLERTRPLDEAAFDAARAALRRDRPDALLASTFAAPAAKAAAVVAREAGVPTIVARHGELGSREAPVMVYNDLDVVDHVLCWGEWEQRFSEEHALRPVRTAVVGAPLVEEQVAAAPAREAARASLGFASGERVVLLVPTGLSGEDWFVGGRTPTDLAYVRHLIDVVERLLGVEGLRVAVKEHALGEGPLETWASSVRAPVTFLHDRTFAELIHAPDAVVLDFPSTTLVQALHGSARLYVLRHPVTSWRPGVLPHLERHGVRIVETGELSASLRADLAAGLLDEPASFPQEVREPLVATGPGTACERAVDAILHILSEQPATTIEPR